MADARGAALRSAALALPMFADAAILRCQRQSCRRAQFAGRSQESAFTPPTLTQVCANLASLCIRSLGIEPRHTMSEVQAALQDSASMTGPGLQTSQAKGPGASAAATVTPCVVHLWSGPRCCSTSLMYSFAQVGLWVQNKGGWPFLNVHGVAQPCGEVVGRLLREQLQEGDRPQHR